LIERKKVQGEWWREEGKKEFQKEISRRLTVDVRAFIIKYRTNLLPTRKKFASRLNERSTEWERKMFGEGECLNCGKDTDTLEHIVGECEFFKSDREEFLKKCSMDVARIFNEELLKILRGQIEGMSEVNDEGSNADQEEVSGVNLVERRERKLKERRLFDAYKEIWTVSMTWWRKSRMNFQIWYKEVENERKKQQKSQKSVSRKERGELRRKKAEEMKRNLEVMEGMRCFLREKKDEMEIEVWKDVDLQDQLMKEAGGMRKRRSGRKVREGKRTRRAQSSVKETRNKKEKGIGTDKRRKGVNEMGKKSLVEESKSNKEEGVGKRKKRQGINEKGKKSKREELRKGDQEEKGKEQVNRESKGGKRKGKNDGEILDEEDISIRKSRRVRKKTERWKEYIVQEKKRKKKEKGTVKKKRKKGVSEEKSSVGEFVPPPPPPPPPTHTNT